MSERACGASFSLLILAKERVIKKKEQSNAEIEQGRKVYWYEPRSVIR